MAATVSTFQLLHFVILMLPEKQAFSNNLVEHRTPGSPHSRNDGYEFLNVLGLACWKSH